MTELAYIFSSIKNETNDFVKKLDSNKGLIGFNNGVYDLTLMKFRKGKQDDYISIDCTIWLYGISY